MNCPNCNSDKSAVKNSRADDHMIRRRRVCVVCGRRWTTLEIEVSEVDRLHKYMKKALHDFNEIIPLANKQIAGVVMKGASHVG